MTIDCGHWVVRGGNDKLACNDIHRRYFQIAGITVCVESELDFNKVKFCDALLRFAAAGPGEDNVTLRQHFGLPDLKGMDLGEELYRKIPWSVSRKGDRWFYLGIGSEQDTRDVERVCIFKAGHTEGDIYSPIRQAEVVCACDGGWHSLSLLPTDQLWIVPLLADRNAVLMHSAGVILGGQGLLFVGHSDAGKSTAVAMLKGRAEILCDDRNIVRWRHGGWRVHGTWSHGDVSEVSASSAPLRAILFLKQGRRNDIEPLTDPRTIWKHLLGTLVKAAVTAEWRRKEIDTLDRLIRDVPCYTMQFDRSGRIVPALEKLVSDG